MSSQNTSKKEFSLTQYYSQLEKYQSGGNTRGKRTSLKKDYSLSNFSKDLNSNIAFQNSKVSAFAKTHKDPLPSKQRLGLSDKYCSRIGFNKVERNQIKKQMSPIENYEGNIFGESLNTSTLTSKKWEGRTEEKENLQDIRFNNQDEERFVSHCSQIYKLNPRSTVTELAREINKRDEVYEVVSQHIEDPSPQRIQNYFEEHALMQKIIQEFKAISKLEIDDLNELYYFLKQDQQ